VSAPIRVLQIVPDLSLGGAERMAVHLVQHLDPARFEVALASLYDSADSELDRRLASSGQTVHYLGKRRGFDARIFLALDRLIRQWRPHVVHTHTISLRYALPPAFLRRVPLRLHTIHSQVEKEAGRWLWLRRLAFGLGVVPVAIADQVQEGVRKHYGIEGAPNIPNGIPLEEYSTPGGSRALWREAEGFIEDQTLLAIVGRLDPGKNHALAIRALAQLAQSHQFELLIVGEGNETNRQRLLGLSRELGVAERVHLLGRREDIPQLLAAVDGFLLPSDFEGNPLTVLEAMAAGRAVITSAVGGVPELVRDGVDGRLFAAGDLRGLCAAISELLDQPERRQSWEIAAQQRAQSRFGVSAMARRYGRLYEKGLRDSLL